MTPNCLFLYLHPTTCPDLDNLTRCIDSLHVWFYANGMALNPDKSEAILLGTHQRAHSYSSLATINVAGSQIPLADHIKILGATFDKNLSMNNHVNVVCIIIFAPYATSVPLYLNTWPKWLRVLSLALASITLTLFYLEPLRKTSPDSNQHRTSSPVLLQVLLNPAVHVLSSSSSTGSRLNTASTSK